MTLNKVGNADQALPTGRLAYGKDSNGIFYPLAVIANTSEQFGEVKVAQREPFIFYPGATDLSGGMVLAGSVTGAATVSSGGTADNTIWSPSYTYAPFRSGKIDGVSTGGYLYGTVTIGVVAAASTC